jgi:hypothetical protein
MYVTHKTRIYSMQTSRNPYQPAAIVSISAARRGGGGMFKNVSVVSVSSVYLLRSMRFDVLTTMLLNVDVFFAVTPLR